MATDVDIANRALSRLGAARITSLEQDVKNARAAKAALEVVREEVLTDHPWNCAVKRGTLFSPTYTITAAAWVGASSRLRVTAAGHTLRTGDTVTIAAVGGMTQINDTWLVGDRTSTTFDLKDPDTGAYVNGAAFTAYTSGGTATLVALYDHRYLYPLPSDCLRVLELEGQRESAWTVESGRVATDLQAPLNFRYVWRNEDTTTYPPILVSAFAARLAVELALEVVDSPDKRNLAMSDYQTILSRAKGADAREQTPDALAESPWITVRLTS